MSTQSIEVQGILPVASERLYAAWLDAREHGAFTGGAATCDPREGGRFSAWDGYITGTTVALEPGRRIIQAWRTTDFPEGAPDSRLEVRLEPVTGGTRVTFVHTGLPEGQGSSYAEGWQEYYLEPMTAYFGGEAATETRTAAAGTAARQRRKPPAKKTRGGRGGRPAARRAQKAAGVRAQRGRPAKRAKKGRAPGARRAPARPRGPRARPRARR